MSSTPSQAQSDSRYTQPPYNINPTIATLDTAAPSVTTDLTLSPSLNGVQPDNSKDSNYTFGIAVLLLLLPVSLPASSTSEHYRRLFGRVRKESFRTGPVSPQSAPLKSANTQTARHFLEEMLGETLSQCHKAQHAITGTLCGAMTLFILAPLVGFRLFMVFVSITCIALFYILSDVPNVAQSLARFEVPHNWSHDDDRLVAMFLALPNATIFLCKLMACVITVGVPLSCDLNILWPMEIIRIFQGALPQTSQSIEPASAPKSPQWLYLTAASYLLLELIRCATVHHMLSRCLRKGYDNDGEKCPQSVSLQTPASNAVVCGLSNQTPNHSAFATHST